MVFAKNASLFIFVDTYQRGWQCVNAILRGASSKRSASALSMELTITHILPLLSSIYDVNALKAYLKSGLISINIVLLVLGVQ